MPSRLIYIKAKVQKGKDCSVCRFHQILRGQNWLDLLLQCPSLKVHQVTYVNNWTAIDHFGSNIFRRSEKRPSRMTRVIST